MADTTPGGRYMGPDGLHDANGNPIKGGSAMPGAPAASAEPAKKARRAKGAPKAAKAAKPAKK